MNFRELGELEASVCDLTSHLPRGRAVLPGWACAQGNRRVNRGVRDRGVLNLCRAPVSVGDALEQAGTLALPDVDHHLAILDLHQIRQSVAVHVEDLTHSVSATAGCPGVVPVVGLNAKRNRGSSAAQRRQVVSIHVSVRSSAQDTHRGSRIHGPVGLISVAHTTTTVSHLQQICSAISVPVNNPNAWISRLAAIVQEIQRLSRRTCA